VSLRPRLRKALALFHLWTGLGLGLYFAMLGVTGSFLVFRSDVEELVAPELARVVCPAGARPLPASAVVAAVRTRFPKADEATLSSLTLPRHPGGAYVLSVDEKTVLVDPYTGGVIRQVDPSRNPIEIVGNLHMDLLWQAKGMLLNTYGGLLTALLVASGLWLWWPATVRQIRVRLSVKRGVSLKRTMNDLHNVLGMAGLAFLLMACLTGAVFGVWQTAHDALYGVLGQTKPAAVPTSVPVPSGARRLSLDTLVANVEAAMPGATLQGMTYPAKPDAPLTAYGAVDEGLSVYVSLALDPYTGRVIQKEDAREVPTAGIVMRWIHFLHLGQWGGWTVKILYALLGLLPLGLFVTGLGRWLLRRRKNRGARRPSGSISDPCIGEGPPEQV